MRGVCDTLCRGPTLIEVPCVVVGQPAQSRPGDKELGLPGQAGEGVGMRGTGQRKERSEAKAPFSAKPSLSLALGSAGEQVLPLSGSHWEQAAVQLGSYTSQLLPAGQDGLEGFGRKEVNAGLAGEAATRACVRPEVNCMHSSDI